MTRPGRSRRRRLEFTTEEITAILDRAAAEAPEIGPDGKIRAFTLVGTCRECGCTDDRACPGGCVWAEPSLCSRCARRSR